MMIPPDVLRPRSFAAMPGWSGADLAGLWTVAQNQARAIVRGDRPLRPARTADSALVRVAEHTAALPAGSSDSDTRAFVERHFEPFLIDAPGFLTGYYEPVVAASPIRTADFTAPVLPRPPDLVTLEPGHTVPGLPPDHAAGRRQTDGRLVAYDDRATLEAAMIPGVQPVAWLRDWTELFLIQVQGSARLRFADGTERRLIYAGRNGHPYTSIGRLLIEAGEIAADAMSLDVLKAWLRRNGQEVGDKGRAFMQRNRSYVFFALAPAGEAGPIGGAGLPLTAHRSIAVDRTIWTYGLPFWIESRTAIPGFGPEPLRRLFVAEDTGSAIVGPARADLFLGTGETAGRAAGSIRHPAALTVLLPRDP